MKSRSNLLLAIMLLVLCGWVIAQRSSDQISLPQVDPSFEYEADTRMRTQELSD